MNLFILWINRAYAVSYVPSERVDSLPVELPSFPHLANVEGLLFIILFMLLIKPLLKEQKDKKLEAERIRILKLSAIVGGLAMTIRFYRLLSGN